jgi:hypothetical protein
VFSGRGERLLKQAQFKLSESHRPRLSLALERLLIERGPFASFQAWIGQGRAEWRANQVAITVGARRCC